MRCDDMSNFFLLHQSMPDRLPFPSHHSINLPYAMCSLESSGPFPKRPLFAMRTRPLAPRSTPQPRWKQWQLSGRIVVELIPGIDSKGMGPPLNGVLLRLAPMVERQPAPCPNRCQSTPSQRWHLSVQLKPQFSFSAWSPSPSKREQSLQDGAVT